MRVLPAIIATIASSSVAAQVVYSGNGCRTCQPGEYAVVDLETVAHGQYTYTAKPTCQTGTNDDAAKLLLTIPDLVAKNYAGALKTIVDTKEFRKASEVIHGEAGKIINGGHTDTANCQLLCNIVPVGAIVQGFSIAAGESATKLSKCSPGIDCGEGYMKFADIPAITKSASSQEICVNFLNWSGDKDRVARLVTYFHPPANWSLSNQRDFEP